MERRRFGSGPPITEIGVSLQGRDAEILREARKAGVDLFHLDDSDDLPWLAEEIGPAPVTVLVGARGPAVGGSYRRGAPDAHLALHTYSTFTSQPGSLGPYQVLGGWEIGSEGAEGAPTRLDVARKVVASKSSQALAVTYTPGEQSAGLDFMREAKRAGLGIVALGLPAATDGHKFLARTGRTAAQASIQFVLANEYVSCALVRPETVDQLREAVAAPDATPLTLGEVEKIIEMYIHRADGGSCR
ncbi:MAG TPA: hypothetical protein VJU16_06230 [Planctomycetota bacterium]|nr:hypothetical protein [Planctomycetota bacterium]